MCPCDPEDPDNLIKPRIPNKANHGPSQILFADPQRAKFDLSFIRPHHPAMIRWQTNYYLRACGRRSSLNAWGVSHRPSSLRIRGRFQHQANYATDPQQSPRQQSATLPILGTIVATAAVTLFASEAWRGREASKTQDIAKDVQSGPFQSGSSKYADVPTMLRVRSTFAA